MFDSYEELARLVKEGKKKRRIAVAAAHDSHTLEGVSEACRQGFIHPILIGDEKAIRRLIEAERLCLDEAEIIHEPDNIKAAKAAVAQIREGKADILMKGMLQTSELMREVVSSESGIKGGGVLSHVGLFSIPAYHKMILLTDGGMLIAPDAEQKRQLAENAVDVMKSLGCSCPKIAVLCATEAVNPKMPASVDAAMLKRWNEEGVLKDCIVEGPISFDLMFSSEAAKVKRYESPVAGDADIWLMPDMTAGNLVAKALMCAAGAKMAGLIVGAKAPIVLVSRGATSEEKYDSLVFAAAIAD